MDPIARTSVADACTRALRDAILAGRFAPGARLPPERKLAEDFGVNRVTVRAALNTLAAERLLKIRQGSGAHVVDFRESGGPELIPAWIGLGRGDAVAGAERDEALADLLAVRRALARVVIDRLQRSLGRDAAALGRIEAAVQAFAATVAETADPARVAAADLAVLRAILAEAKSPVLALSLNPIAAVLEALPELRDAMFAAPATNVAAWAAFVEALRAPAGGLNLAALFADVLAERDQDTLERLARKRSKR